MGTFIGLVNYESCLSGTTVEVAWHCYKATKLCRVDGFVNKACDLNTGDRCSFPVSYQQSTVFSFNRDRYLSLALTNSFREDDDHLLTLTKCD